MKLETGVILKDRYQIRSVLGEGGMSIVYIARDRELGRDVALKVLDSGLAKDEEFVHRFLREARSAARLEHPNIVPIYDIGSADGINFFAMKKLEGETLADYLDKKGALPPAEVVRIIRQVADSVDFAHSKGVVHRDIKPSNIMLCADGSVVLMDFGIARASDMDGSGETSALTIANRSQTMVLGTPTYMSPEQIEGHLVGNRADIYSLGVVCYQMLTAHAPFEGSKYQVISAHVTTPPPPLSKFKPGLGGALEQVIAKALSKEPTQRYGTAHDLAAALATAANGPVAARRSWARVAIAAVLVLLVIGGGLAAVRAVAGGGATVDGTAATALPATPTIELPTATRSPATATIGGIAFTPNTATAVATALPPTATPNAAGSTPGGAALFSTIAPTFTPLPPNTATPTIPPPPTDKPVPPTATRPPAPPTATNTPGARYAAVVLSQPENGQRVEGDSVTFEWQESAAVSNGDHYEVKFKRDGIADWEGACRPSSRGTCALTNKAAKGFGSYVWTVTIVDNAGAIVSTIGELRKFTWVGDSGGGGCPGGPRTC